MKRALAVKTIFLMLSLAFSHNSFSADSTNENQQSIDDVLQGFDEPAIKDSSEIDQILEGFDSSTPGESNSIDDVLGGFDQLNSKTIESDPENIETPRAWDLINLFSISSSYNFQHKKPETNQTDFRGLSRLKLKLQPEFRYQFNKRWDTVISASGFYDLAYRINSRSDYTSQVLDAYEWEMEVREVYLRGTITSSLDIKLGRQVVVWGKSDSIRVVDVLNPLDFREPGMVDIEDLRLPVTMVKTDYYFSDWNLSAMLIPEVRENKRPAFGSDFYFGNPNQPPSEENEPEFGSLEYALALIGTFSGWDTSFHFASVYDDTPYLTQDNTLDYSRLMLFGFANNVALGNWLLKSELAYLNGILFNQLPDEYNRADVMLGVDYSGFTNTTLSVEAVTRRITNYDNVLSIQPNFVEKDEGQIAFRYNANFLREKLDTTLLISLLGYTLEDGAFYRASLSYELMDAMSILFGFIVYQSGDSQLSKVVANNDRVFMDWRYSF